LGVCRRARSKNVPTLSGAAVAVAGVGSGTTNAVTAALAGAATVPVAEARASPTPTDKLVMDGVGRYRPRLGGRNLDLTVIFSA